MCHLLLFMPAIALPIFWIIPLSISVPIYMVIVITSGVLYWLIANSMRRIPRIGVESLVSTDAEVISKINPGHRAQYLVRSQGELWSARCPSVLEIGEIVRIAAVDGISLLVNHKDKDSHINNSSYKATALDKSRMRANERHCH
jgi:membrane protein implicated in regulation of membrane protease activity